MNVKWEDFLAEKLQNPKKALMYLNVSLSDEDPDVKKTAQIELNV